MTSRVELTTVPKRHLRKATIYVERLETEYWKQYSTFIWNVDNFMNLKDTVVYTREIEGYGWDLRLKKKRCSATVTLNIKSRLIPYNISWYVRYDDSFNSTNTSAPFVPRQVSAGSYEVTFPTRAINSPKNCRLKHGTLSLEFRFNERKRERIHSSRYTRDYWGSNNLDASTMFQNPLLTDFAIKPAEGRRIIKCHKAFLAARSIFFRDYFIESCNNGNEISMSTSFDILLTVIVYVYGFPFQSPGNLKLMGDIIKLTWELDIPSLKTVCIKYLCRVKGKRFEDLLEEVGIEVGLTFMMEMLNTLRENIHHRTE